MNDLIPISQIFLYQTEDRQTKIEVKLQDETVWLTKKQMAELFNVKKQDIDYHVQNVYTTGELELNSTTKNFLVVQKEGSRQIRRDIVFYNLDMIISVGYRVNSYRGTQFRIWATQRLKEYIIKGFVMDDERLAEGETAGKVNYLKIIKFKNFNHKHYENNLKKIKNFINNYYLLYSYCNRRAYCVGSIGVRFI